ncbi:MAG: hypothetical protein KAJ12_07780, partial [Bacteroidetes bacterium]|nr:hypothetical protein [Bacteroidota bacterium]
MRIPHTLLVLCVAAPLSLLARDPVLVSEKPGERVEVQNGLVRALILKDSTGFREEYFAWDGSWRLLLRSGNRLRPEPALMSDGQILRIAFTDVAVVHASPDRVVLQLNGAHDGHFVSKTITLDRGDRVLHFVVKDSIPGICELSYLLSTYSYVPDGRLYREYEPLDFVWTPQLRPDSDDVIADHTFRSPAVML